MVTKHPPTSPCWVIFRGIRHSKRPGTIRHLNEPVRIVEIVFPRQELGVCHVGNDTLYPLSAYDGEWIELSLEAV